jgi:MFS family permease
MRHNLTRSPTAHRLRTRHAAPPPRQPWPVLALLSIAPFMVVLDATVVSVALPSIGRALHLASADLPWVATAYVLLTGGLVLLGGRASDLLPGLVLGSAPAWCSPQRRSPRCATSLPGRQDSRPAW